MQHVFHLCTIDHRHREIFCHTSHIIRYAKQPNCTGLLCRFACCSEVRNKCAVAHTCFNCCSTSTGFCHTIQNYYPVTTHTCCHEALCSLTSTHQLMHMTVMRPGTEWTHWIAEMFSSLRTCFISELPWLCPATGRVALHNSPTYD